MKGHEHVLHLHINGRVSSGYFVGRIGIHFEYYENDNPDP